MLDDRRLDTKLEDLARELRTRPLVAGFPISDAFTVRGLDEAGRPGLFAAVLLTPNTIPELDTLTAFRDVLTKKLKQLDTTMPAWPIVVQGSPELIDGVPTVPGGQEYFQQLKGELLSRSERLKQVQEKKANLDQAVAAAARKALHAPRVVSAARPMTPLSTSAAKAKVSKAKPTARRAARPVKARTTARARRS